MKITGIEQFFPRPRIRLVKIITDNGLVGWGETTLEGKPKSTVAAVEELSDYLVGKDPLRIEHHWQHIYRSAFFRGGNVLMTALSGLIRPCGTLQVNIMKYLCTSCLEVQFEIEFVFMLIGELVA